MRDLTNEILELIRRTSSDLPLDVEERSRRFMAVAEMIKHDPFWGYTISTETAEGRGDSHGGPLAPVPPTSHNPS